jgi:hypothetical protein
MGRPSLTQSDALVLSPLANDTTLRHELFHRGMRRLESQGLSIDRDDEEMVARIFDYKLGNNEDKARSVWFWKEYYDMTPDQVLNDKYFMDLLDKVQNEAFMELRGTPIPGPFMQSEEYK